MLTVLLLAVAVLAVPATLGPVPRLNFHAARAFGIDLQLRQEIMMCPTGYEICAETTCHPMDSSVCCSDGSFCPANYNCVPNMCCPFGNVCDNVSALETSTPIDYNGTLPAPSKTSTVPTAGPTPPPLPQTQSSVGNSASNPRGLGPAWSSLRPGSASAAGSTSTTMGITSGAHALNARLIIWAVAALVAFV